jgi:hypothetical protein
MNVTLEHRMEVKKLVHALAATIFLFLISVLLLPAEILNAMSGKPCSICTADIGNNYVA